MVFPSPSSSQVKENDKPLSPIFCVMILWAEFQAWLWQQRPDPNSSWRQFMPRFLFAFETLKILQNPRTPHSQMGAPCRKTETRENKHRDKKRERPHNITEKGRHGRTILFAYCLDDEIWAVPNIGVRSHKDRTHRNGFHECLIDTNYKSGRYVLHHS